MKRWTIRLSVCGLFLLCLTKSAFAESKRTSTNMLDEYKSRLYFDVALKREYIEWQIDQTMDRSLYTESSLEKYDQTVQLAKKAIDDSETSLYTLNTISFQLQQNKYSLEEINRDDRSESSQETLVQLVAYTKTLDFQKIKNTESRNELFRCLRETEQYFISGPMTERQVQDQFLKLVHILNQTVDFMKERDDLDYRRLIQNLRRVEKLQFDKLSNESLHAIYKEYLKALTYYEIETQDELNKKEKKFSRLIDNLAYMKKVDSISQIRKYQAIGLGGCVLAIGIVLWIRKKNQKSISEQ